MASVGFPELVLLFVIGLLILGPERLPRVAAQIGRWVGKARRTANQLRYQMEREIALAEIDRTQSKKPDKQTGESGAGDTGDRSGSGAPDAESASESDRNPPADSAPGDESAGAAAQGSATSRAGPGAAADNGAAAAGSSPSVGPDDDSKR